MFAFLGREMTATVLLSLVLALATCAHGSSNGAFARQELDQAEKTMPLWPLPKATSLGVGTVQVNDVFTFTQMQSTKSSLLERAAIRYSGLIRGSNSSPAAKGGDMLSSCGIVVDKVLPDDQEAGSLGLGVDESYKITISQSFECIIESKTVWGALHAMETFTQLLKRSSGAIHCDYVPVTISDEPRYSHRGLLVDTSRHYLPLSTLKQAVDSMVLAHFNVLHWHIVDAQSFPLNAPSAPEIVKGAYAPSMTYTVEQLKEMNEYATDRGVRLLFEVDVPGHASSWGRGYPQLIPKGCADKYTKNVNNVALNPTLDETVSVMTAILRDIRDATSAKYLHLGGDEVVYGCWEADPTIAQYMADNQIASYQDLFAAFIVKADDVAGKLGVTPIHWEDVFIYGVKPPPSTIFNVWTNSEQIANVTSAGYQVIAAPSDYWYLDHDENTWQRMYSYDPASGLTQEQAALIVGGETCMWGEYVDQDNWFARVWPRAAAVGERLWSPLTNKVDTDDALSRLLVFRCRLQARGFYSTPLQPGFCATHYV